MKHKESTKALSWLLSIVLLLSLIPSFCMTALAISDPLLYVGGARITDANANDVFGDGKVRYDAENNTLTLTNYSNDDAYYIETDTHVYDSENGYRMAAGIYYGGTETLTVALAGTNTLTMPAFSEDKLDNAAIFANGDLIFIGEGSLNATSGAASDSSAQSNVGSFGLCFRGETAAFEGSGTLSFTAADGESSYGVFAIKGAIAVTGSGQAIFEAGNAKCSYGIYSYDGITVSGGTVEATGGPATKESCGFISDNWGGVIVNSGGSLTATGGTVTGEKGFSYGVYNTMYQIEVAGGTLVANGGDVTGSQGQSIGLYSILGPVYFETGAQVSCNGGDVTGSQGVSYGIRCAGLDVEGCTAAATGGAADDSCGVYNDISLSVIDGSLTATGGSAKRSRGIYNDSLGVEVTGGTVIATGGSGTEESSGVYLAARKLKDGSINGATLTVTGGTATARSGEGTGSGSYGVFCDPAFDGKTVLIAGGTLTAAGKTASLSKAPIMGADVTARGSSAIDGSGPTEYVEADNNSYKWFETVGAPGEKTLITKVAFTVEEPVAGAVPAEKVQISTEPAGALRIEEYDAVWLESDDYIKNGFTPMTTATFKAGKYYAVEQPNETNAGGPMIVLAASGYAVSTDLELEPEYTVNGEEVVLLFSYLKNFGRLKKTSIDQISVDFRLPMAEDTTEDYAEYQSSLFDTPYHAGYTVDSVAFYDADDNPFTGDFEAGKTYTVSIRLKADEDFAFRGGGDTAPAPEDKVRFTILGRDVSNTVETPYAADTVTARYTFTVGAGASEFGLSVSPTSLTFAVGVGYEGAPTQTITAENTGTGEIDFILGGWADEAAYNALNFSVGGMSMNVYPKEGLPLGTHTFHVTVSDWYNRVPEMNIPVTIEVLEESPFPTLERIRVTTPPDQTVYTEGDSFDDSGMAVTAYYSDGSTKENVIGLVWIVDDPLTTADREVVIRYTDENNYTRQTTQPITVWPKSSGGGYVPQFYTLTYNTNGGSAIAATGHTAGTTVNLTAAPAREGFTFDGWYSEASLTNRITSIKMDGNKTVYAGWKENEKPDGSNPSDKFTDVPSDAWYKAAVDYVVEKGLMVGPAADKFAPDAAATRAMIVTILYRLEGEPMIRSGMPFDDVTERDWYAMAVSWAESKGIVSGYGDGRFGPDDPVTREQLATLLYRYAQYKGEGFKGLWSFRLDFPDAGEMSDWATEAMSWMVMNGVINGKDGKLVPGGEATRAEAATMIQRFCESVTGIRDSLD